MTKIISLIYDDCDYHIPFDQIEMIRIERVKDKTGSFIGSKFSIKCKAMRHELVAYAGFGISMKRIMSEKEDYCIELGNDKRIEEKINEHEEQSINEFLEKYIECPKNA